MLHFLLTAEICPQGWSIFSDFCYHINNISQKNWTDARKICLNSNSDLASIASRDENDFVLSLLKDYNVTQLVWIGLKQNETDQFVWSDGSKVTYPSEAVSSSGQFGASPYCGLMNASQSVEWKIASCSLSQVKYAICKRKGQWME